MTPKPTARQTAIAKLARDNTKEQLATRHLDLLDRTRPEAAGKALTITLPKPQSIRKDAYSHGYNAGDERLMHGEPTLGEIDETIAKYTQTIANLTALRARVAKQIETEQAKLHKDLESLTGDNPDPETLALRLIERGYVDPNDITRSYTRRGRY